MSRSDLVKMSFYFSGVTVFALLVAVLLHEVGHALAVYLTENEIARISFNPLAGAVTRYSTTGNNPAAARFISFGGVIFGSIFSILIASPFILRFRNPWTTPFFMIAVASLASHGLMLLIGVFLLRVGDVARLLSLGVSPGLLFHLGAILLLLSLYFLLKISPYLGLDPSVSFKNRCIIAGGGLFPYILCVIAYNAIYQPEKIIKYIIYVAVGLGLGLLAIFLCGCLQNLLIVSPTEKREPIERKHAVYVCSLAISIIILLIMTGSFHSF